MDIRDLPKVVILICVLIYVTEGTKQNGNLLETPIVGRDGNHAEAQDTDTVITSPKDGNYKLSYADYEVTWRKYKRDHNKRYLSSGEEKRRFAIFMKDVKKIEAHNMEYHLGQSTYWMDINQFSDWTHQEFTAWLGPQDKDVHSRSKRQAGIVYRPKTGEMLPEAINWTAKGFVTDVKDQADCGSCYAFSTTGSVEGQWFRKTRKLINLSEQQIVDCSTNFGNRGCSGGNRIASFRYIMAEGGLQNETTYPYKAVGQICKFNKSLVVAQIQNYYTVPEDEEALKSAVGTQGPVSVAIFASDNFTDYAGGIFYEKNCSTDLHALLIVGYGSSEGEDYWIVKNCWGSTWGKNWMGSGYVNIARNKGGMGTCGIASRASFPVVSDASSSSFGGSNNDRASSSERSKKRENKAIKLENNAITVIVTTALAFLKFTQPCF